MDVTFVVVPDDMAAVNSSMEAVTMAAQVTTVLLRLLLPSCLAPVASVVLGVAGVAVADLSCPKFAVALLSSSSAIIAIWSTMGMSCTSNSSANNSSTARSSSVTADGGVVEGVTKGPGR